MLPDCDWPRVAAHCTWPASGFAAPVESAVSFLKNEATSRKAAKPRPNTGGSCAVKETWYISFGSKPPLTQSCVGSGVPGNGLSALHFANAQSVDAITRSPSTRPSVCSAVWVTSLAFAVLRLTGLYGVGLVATYIADELGPLVFMIRAITRPVIGEPSGFLATGTTT